MSESAAVKNWREKLEFLQAEEAKAVDAAAKFKIKKEIAEAQERLSALQAEAQPLNVIGRQANISLIVKYAPAELIGREEELKWLNNAWAKVQKQETGRPRILTFVALGGEGKTSLVAKWVADLAAQDWPGIDATFAWTFHSQGTHEQQAASSDLFLKEALTFFGDKETAESDKHSREKGKRLATLIGEKRALLILDRLEPLQYPLTSTHDGRLKDDGIAALLTGLATASHGLCIVTTRYSLPDLKAFMGKTVREEKLTRLSRRAGVDLLRRLGVKGSELRNIPSSNGKEQLNEFEKLVEDVKGHALTLTLLGGFLKRAFRGDIRQRDRVKFEKADEKMDGGHAFRTMAAYEQWLLRDGGNEGQREVAVLRLMGLFDRPANAGCLHALLQPPAVPALTEPLVDLAEDDWEFCLTGLESAHLLTINRDASANPQPAIRNLQSLDAHPLLREYFAKQLRDQNLDAWRAAHQRLYDYLCASTPDKPQPTLEDLQPLYQAVVHGCEGGMYEQTWQRVYDSRIQRGRQHYATSKLGTFGENLRVLRGFFDPISDGLVSFADLNLAYSILNEMALCLRACGRLDEAAKQWKEALRLTKEVSNASGSTAEYTRCLSELHLILGKLEEACQQAEESVALARRAGNPISESFAWARLGYGQLLAGRTGDAQSSFKCAEQSCAKGDPGRPVLRPISAFQYGELILAPAERYAWRWLLNGRHHAASFPRHIDELSAHCTRGEDPARRALETFGGTIGPLNRGLLRLTLSRADAYRAVLQSHEPKFSDANAAVEDLLKAQTYHHLPGAFLTRAWLRAIGRDYIGALEDLNDAWEIAERGPMHLFMADTHLYRARLFFHKATYPWESPAADLAAAGKLINDCGYHRRDEELADAKKAILGG